MVRSEVPEPAADGQSLGDLVALAAKDVSQLIRYEIDLCAQGPPIWTTASAPPAMRVTSPGLVRGDLGLAAVGLLAVAAEYPETLGHGLARLL